MSTVGVRGKFSINAVNGHHGITIYTSDINDSLTQDELYTHLLDNHYDFIAKVYRKQDIVKLIYSSNEYNFPNYDMSLNNFIETLIN